MAKSTPRKPSLSKKSLIGQALFVVALLLLGRFLWMRQQPEHLQMTPSIDVSLGFIALTESTCYLPQKSGFGLRAGETAICAQSLQTGELREIAKESSQYAIYALAPEDALVSHGNLYYTAAVHNVSQAPQERDNIVTWSRRTGGYIGSRSIVLAENANKGSDMGFFLMPPPGSAVVADSKRISLETREIFPPGYQVRQVALSGGTPQDAPIPPGSGFVLCADHVFWIRPAVEQTAEVVQGETPQARKHWKEMTARSDLMLTSLPDGATRCIRHGIYGSTLLIAGPSGISWWEPALYPRPNEFFYARAADGRVTALGARPVGKDVSPCVEMGGRLYWTDWNTASESVTVMSAALDGSDRHEVPGIVANRQIGHLQLYPYRGNLYGYMQETSARGQEDYPISLCRIHPDRPDPIEIVRKISGRGVAVDAVSNLQFSGGYLYFRLVEPGIRRIPLQP